MIGVAIAAASELERSGLAAMLAGAGLRVIGAWADWQEAAHSEGADILVITENADEVIERIADLPPVVLLADRAQNAASALRGGIRAVLPRDSSAAELRAAIEAVHAGWAVLAPQDVPALITAVQPVSSTVSLSRREIDVLRMMAEGLGNKEIAFRLGISEHTVKFHVNAILNKLGAGSRTEAVMLGLRQGLVLL